MKAKQTVALALVLVMLISVFPWQPALAFDGERAYGNWFENGYSAYESADWFVTEDGYLATSTAEKRVGSPRFFIDQMRPFVISFEMPTPGDFHNIYLDYTTDGLPDWGSAFAEHLGFQGPSPQDGRSLILYKNNWNELNTHFGEHITVSLIRESVGGPLILKVSNPDGTVLWSDEAVSAAAASTGAILNMKTFNIQVRNAYTLKFRNFVAKNTDIDTDIWNVPSNLARYIGGDSTNGSIDLWSSFDLRHEYVYAALKETLPAAYHISYMMQPTIGYRGSANDTPTGNMVLRFMNGSTEVAKIEPNLTLRSHDRAIENNNWINLPMTPFAVTITKALGSNDAVVDVSAATVTTSFTISNVSAATTLEFGARGARIMYSDVELTELTSGGGGIPIPNWSYDGAVDYSAGVASIGANASGSLTYNGPESFANSPVWTMRFPVITSALATTSRTHVMTLNLLNANGDVVAYATFNRTGTTGSNSVNFSINGGTDRPLNGLPTGTWDDANGWYVEANRLEGQGFVSFALKRRFVESDSGDYGILDFIHSQGKATLSAQELNAIVKAQLVLSTTGTGSSLGVGMSSISFSHHPAVVSNTGITDQASAAFMTHIGRFNNQPWWGVSTLQADGKYSIRATPTSDLPRDQLKAVFSAQTVAGSDEWIASATLDVPTQSLTTRRVSSVAMVDGTEVERIFTRLEFSGSQMYVGVQVNQFSGGWSQNYIHNWFPVGAYTNITVNHERTAAGNLIVRIYGNETTLIASQTLSNTAFGNEIDAIYAMMLLAENWTTVQFRNVYASASPSDVTLGSATETVMSMMDGNYTEVYGGRSIIARTTHGIRHNYTNPDGSPWERFSYLSAIKTYLDYLYKYDPGNTAEINKYKLYLDNEVLYVCSIAEYMTNNAGGQRNIVVAGTGHNTAHDDVGWNLMWLAMLAEHAGQNGMTSQRDLLLARARLLFVDVYRWVNADFLDGMWYRSSSLSGSTIARYRDQWMSSYAAAIALAGLDLANLDSANAADYRAKSEVIYRGVKSVMGRADGLYWTDVGYAGVSGKENPYGIGTAGSASFIAANMAMTVLDLRFNNVASAQNTLRGMARYQNTMGGYTNDRDAWANGTFIGPFVREVLNDSGNGVSEALKDIHRVMFYNTAQAIMRNSIDSSRYNWVPNTPGFPQRPSGNPATYMTGFINADWYGGRAWSASSTAPTQPDQIMTGATTVSFVVGAALANGDASRPKLDDLTANGEAIAGFDPDVTTYTLPALSGENSSVLLAGTAGPGLTVRYNGLASGDIALITGLNRILVQVSDGLTTTTYVLSVTYTPPAPPPPPPAPPPPPPPNVSFDNAGITAVQEDGVYVVAIKASAFEEKESETEEPGEPEADVSGIYSQNRGLKRHYIYSRVQPVMLRFDAQELQNLPKMELYVNTPSGVVILNADHLKALYSGGASKVEILIHPGSLDLKVLVDDEPAFWPENLPPAVLGIPYSLKPGEKGEQVVAFHYNESGVKSVVPSSRYMSGFVFLLARAPGRYAAEHVSIENDLPRDMAYLAARGILSLPGLRASDSSRRITREEGLIMVMATLGLKTDAKSPRFLDVKENEHYAPYVSAARSLGIVSGVGNNMFGIGRNLSVEQAMAMLANALVKVTGAVVRAPLTLIESIPDSKSVAGYAKQTAANMVAAGIIPGNLSLQPKTHMTYASFSQLLASASRTTLSGFDGRIFPDRSGEWTMASEWTYENSPIGVPTLTTTFNPSSTRLWYKERLPADSWVIRTTFEYLDTQLEGDRYCARLAFSSNSNDLTGMLTVNQTGADSIEIRLQTLYSNAWKDYLAADNEEITPGEVLTMRLTRQAGKSTIIVEVIGSLGYYFKQESDPLPAAELDNIRYVGLTNFLTAVRFSNFYVGLPENELDYIWAVPHISTAGSAAEKPPEQPAEVEPRVAPSVTADHWSLPENGWSYSDGALLADFRTGGNPMLWNTHSSFSNGFFFQAEVIPRSSYHMHDLIIPRFAIGAEDNDLLGLFTIRHSPSNDQMMVEFQTLVNNSWSYQIYTDWFDVGEAEKLTFVMAREPGSSTVSLMIMTDQGFSRTLTSGVIPASFLNRIRTAGLTVEESSMSFTRILIENY